VQNLHTDVLVLSCFRSFFLLLVSTLKRSVVARTRGTDIKSTTTRRWTPGLVRKLDEETRFIAARSGLLATALPASSQGHERRSTCTPRAQISFWNAPARGKSGLHEMSATFRQR
jgi:hypothetical protein